MTSVPPNNIVINSRAMVFLLMIGALLTLVACNSPATPVGETPSGVASVSTPVEEETAVVTATSSPSPTPLPPTETPPATATPVPTATPTAEPATPGELFTVYQNEPIVPHGPDGRWDGQFTDPGGAVYHDGRFHMLHNGFVGWPAPVGVAYSSAEDGFTWQRENVDPVFVGDDLPYVGLTALASSLLVEEDGTWVLYFYTWDEPSWPAPTKIGRATAPGPDGPWTADLEPVLLPGPEGAWDSYAVRAASVVRDGDGYLMFYSGYTENESRIGMAASEDGVHWQKYDDPATGEAPFAESDPVFIPAGIEAWDKFHVSQPRVVRSPDGLVMLYSAAASVRGSGAQLGYAVSQDGVQWARSAEPILQAGDVPGGRAIWFTELLYQEGTYFLFFELGTGGETEVYLATHDGPLPVP